LESGKVLVNWRLRFELRRTFEDHEVLRILRLAEEVGLRLFLALGSLVGYWAGDV